MAPPLKALGLGLILLGVGFAPCRGGSPSSDAPADTATIDWPTATATEKPWTRWWWLGSAVEPERLTELLETYQRAGLGGVEVTCIYGVVGNEATELRYRSPEWVEAVRHTIEQADRLGMGTDLPAGSGWRMGGPNVPRELANTQIVLATQDVQGPRRVDVAFGDATPIAASARGPEGRVVELTEHLRDGRLEWQAPAGEWSLVTAAYRLSGDRVKRPSPGGEGFNINPFWSDSVNAFLADFGSTLRRLPGVRAQFHDSFEYQGDFSPDFFAEFARRRGYRLERELFALAGGADPDRVARVKSDYRETLSDLVLDELVRPWVVWSHRHGALARNQSHGSPANWLDLYAACDIPETESFGRLSGGDADPLVLKFASSAANVTGKRLVSSETATWLDEHFTVELAQLKQVLDRQLLAGVNHVVYHGTCYSPADAPWPGWLFYASTQLHPRNPIWRDLPAINRYATRCQSLLQRSQPDNDVLLYWPLHDLWHDAEGIRKDLQVHNSKRWFTPTPVGEAASLLQERGFAFDYVSDRMLAQLRAGENGEAVAPGGAYRAIVVPAAVRLPLSTAERLVELAEEGVPVLFWRRLPESLPGLAGMAAQDRWQAERERFSSSMARLQSLASVSDDLPAMLDNAGAVREAWAATEGVAFLRRRRADGTLYLLVNPSEKRRELEVAPSANAVTTVLMDPMDGAIGAAAPGAAAESVRLQLEPRGSLFLLRSNRPVTANAWPYRDAAEPGVKLDGTWNVRFTAGGPRLPAGYASPNGPEPWTKRGDADADAFAGTAVYSCEFESPDAQGRFWLDLGVVHGSARVALNGQAAGVLVGPSWGTAVGPLRAGRNLLEVEVTGVAANRVRDLDRRGVAWRVFEDINFVNIDYRPFDASGWPVRPIGMSGPVTLTPLVGSTHPPGR